MQIAITRYLVSVAGAVIVTTFLFYLMKFLISASWEVQDPPPHVVLDWVKPMEMEQVKPRERKVERPEPPDEVPPLPNSHLPTGVDGVIFGVPIFHGPTEGVTAAFGASDATYLPLVKVQPVYPRRALQKGVEGYVVVEFDIGPDGSVRNPRVVELHPGNMFDRAALEAVMKFRYKPQVDNGQASIVTGVQNRFTFEISGA